MKYLATGLISLILFFLPKGDGSTQQPLISQDPGPTATTDIDTITPVHENGASLSLFPNPCTGSCTVDYASEEFARMHFRILSPEGELVFKEDLRKQNSYTREIDLSKFSPGIYFVEMRSEDRITVKKLVVN